MVNGNWELETIEQFDYLTNNHLMKHIVIGTAGHIDHGKTWLTKALTGVDTDRLPEEKLREMSIDLGFAPFYLTRDVVASIVDVPGHERFVRNMVAGVTGIDMVLFVIAADDGIMPQTVEHMQILNLLGLKHGIIVLTKIDLVANDWIELVKNEIHNLVEPTFLKDAPIIPVSVVQNKGIEELKSAIQDIVKNIRPRDTTVIFRLPIDRVFTISGFGTVVTGTLISGKISVGAEVEILPKGKRSRIRGIQVHNEAVQEASAGQRTAINLRDVGKAELTRGNVITVPDMIDSTYRIDAKLSLLKTYKRPLANMTRIRFHTGTSEIMARVKLLDKDKLQPDDSAFVQLQLEEKTAVLRGDRFIIRRYSPQSTMGGGIVLDPYALKHKRFDNKVLADLKVLESGNINEIVISKIKTYKRTKTLKDKFRAEGKNLDVAIKALTDEGKVKVLGTYLFNNNYYRELVQHILDKIKTHHENNPLMKWIPKDQIRKEIPVAGDALDLLLSHVPEIEFAHDKLRLVGWSPKLDEADLRKKREIEQTFLNAKFSPPTVEAEVIAEPIFQALIDDGTLVKVGESLFFHKDCLEEAKQKIKNFISERGGATPSELKNLLNTTRKYMIPLLEYLDKIKFTRRKGDSRILYS